MTLAATATMLLMLLLLAGFWLVQAGLAAGVQYVEQKVEIVADLHDVAGAEGSLTRAGRGPRRGRRGAALRPVRRLRLEGRGPGAIPRSVATARPGGPDGIPGPQPAPGQPGGQAG